MKQRIVFLITYYLFWLFSFWTFKALFLLYHFTIYSPFTSREIFKVFIYGSRLDLSFSSYITILPLLLLILSSFFKADLFQKIIRIYTYILLGIMSLICVSDLEIFKWWGFRIDSSLFKYLKTPKEAAASMGSSPVFLLVVLILVFTVVLASFYRRLIDKKHKFTGSLQLPYALLTLLVMLLFIPPLIIAIRGGTQLAAINQSSVAFSNNQFLNHAAINAPWNLVYSILENHHNETNPFVYLSPEEAHNRFQKHYSYTSQGKPQIIKNKNINVVLLIWESFTAKTVGAMGGTQGITPGFEKLIHEGILFDQIYASGDRSDKGLVAVLSGFPSQPITSIMQKTAKVTRLPSLGKSFDSAGYSTSFYYGGEPEFANIKSYLLAGRFQRLVTKDEFPKETYNSKWGAHDEVVLNRLLKDLETEQQPFFSSLFTLSSHEPFEVPMAPLLPGKDEESKFLNCMHYTDSCIYSFVESAKKTKWWDNTLIIIIADHGHRLPGNPVADHKPGEFKIPMLWLGGALTARDTVISAIGSQTDLSKTLLEQLGLETKKYIFGKDLFNKEAPSFAYYAFKNGFGYISPFGQLVFDNISQNFIQKDPSVTEEQIKDGKAYLQFSYQEYLNK